MPKKRSTHIRTKPFSSPHPSLSSSHLSPTTASQDTPSVNALLSHLRLTQRPKNEPSAIQSTINAPLSTPLAPSNMNLAPAVAPLTPRQRWIERRRARGPAGPPPPRSWTIGAGTRQPGLMASTHARPPLSANPNIALSPPPLPHQDLPAETSLKAMSLRSLSRNWHWFLEENVKQDRRILQYLSELPTYMRMALPVYVARERGASMTKSELEALVYDRYATEPDLVFLGSNFTHLTIGPSLGANGGITYPQLAKLLGGINSKTAKELRERFDEIREEEWENYDGYGEERGGDQGLFAEALSTSGDTLTQRSPAIIEISGQSTYKYNGWPKETAAKSLRNPEMLHKPKDELLNDVSRTIDNETEEVPESWDDESLSPHLSIPPSLFPQLRYLSLARCPSPSWEALLQTLLPSLSGITHLDLSFWPAPTGLLPDLPPGTTYWDTALQPRHRIETHPTTIALRRLSRGCPYLQHLSLQGCNFAEDVAAAFQAFDTSDTASPETVSDPSRYEDSAAARPPFSNLTTINMSQGFIPRFLSLNWIEYVEKYHAIFTGPVTAPEAPGAKYADYKEASAWVITEHMNRRAGRKLIRRRGQKVRVLGTLEQGDEGKEVSRWVEKAIEKGQLPHRSSL